jgi:hypothetical protein
MTRILRTALLVFAAIGLTAAASAQYVPGQQPVLFSPYQPPAQSTTAVTQTTATLSTSALKSGIIEVTGTLTAAVAAPVITGTTTSIATYTLAASTDTFSGLVAVSVSGVATPCAVTLPAYTSLSAAVTAFNANTNCNTTNGLTASTSGATFVLTQGGSSLAITNNGSALVDNKAWTGTWAIQGSIDNGVTWVSLPTAALPTTSNIISTTAVTQATAVTTQASTSQSFYVVSLAGFNRFHFVTSSTYTTGLVETFRLSGVPVGGYL